MLTKRILSALFVMALLAGGLSACAYAPSVDGGYERDGPGGGD